MGDDLGNDFVLRPVGVVKSAVAWKEKMPRWGVPAAIEIYPEYAEALYRIEENTHIMVMGWLHHSDRSILQIDRENWAGGRHRMGVFACRSPVRPNPIGTTTTRLLKRENNTLYVANLDMVDGTPVIDIKPHASGFDGVFCARSARDLSKARRPNPQPDYRAMFREAENFHGEFCPGIALGVRMLYHARVSFDIAQRDPDLVVTIGKNGHVADALQALSGATFGNGRLRWGGGPDFTLSYGGRHLHFSLKPLNGKDIDDIFAAEAQDLFSVLEK